LFFFYTVILINSYYLLVYDKGPDGLKKWLHFDFPVSNLESHILFPLHINRKNTMTQINKATAINPVPCVFLRTTRKVGLARIEKIFTRIAHTKLIRNAKMKKKVCLIRGAYSSLYANDGDCQTDLLA